MSKTPEQQFIFEVRKKTVLAAVASVMGLCAVFGFLLFTQYKNRKEDIEENTVINVFLALQQKDRVKMAVSYTHLTLPTIYSV